MIKVYHINSLGNEGIGIEKSVVLLFIACYDILMSEKHSMASKARMARYSKEELSERMKQVALKKWAKMSVEEKSAHGKKMSLAKYAKAM